MSTTVSSLFKTQRLVKLGCMLAFLTVLTVTVNGCDTPANQLAGAALSASGAADDVTARLQAESEGAVQIEIFPPTGAARWVAAHEGALSRQFSRQTLGVEGVARSFLSSYSRLFGLSEGAPELQLQTVETDAKGMEHVQFQQAQNGITVFGAELLVHLDTEGGVTVVNGYTVPDARAVNTIPTLSAEAAAQAALSLAQAQWGITDGQVTENTLVLLNPALFTEEASPTYLTYKLRIDSPSQPTLGQWFFIDATTGALRFTYPAVTDARYRVTYNVQRTTNLSGSLVRTERDSAVSAAVNCTATDINNAHDFAGQTYDFYFSRFGRDSYDGAGASIKSLVCYGVNLKNAFWNGTQMIYGEGMPFDDVVGHELSHAVTERISGLVYSGQAGALNESFSDIMGEALDLSNGSGNDAVTVRWDMGEEIANSGALRDMLDPTRFGSPDRTDSPLFSCTSDVHVNSAIQNKAFALMVDGGVFNSYTVSSIGLDRAVQILYRAHDRYLTASSTFVDAYNAINRACSDLYPLSITCAMVQKALLATKMNAPVCGASGSATPPAQIVPLLNPDFESGRNIGWHESNNLGYWAVDGGLGENGSWGAWFGGAHNEVTEVWQSFTVPANGGSLLYAFKIESEDWCGYDYGYVLVNNVPLVLYKLCASNQTTGFAQAAVNLSAYAGQLITLQFRGTTDDSLISNFKIDNVRFAPASFSEPIDPHAGTLDTLPEPKGDIPQAKVEGRQSGFWQLFLPLANR